MGARIRHLRTQKGWSQRALARRLGLSYSRLSRIEHGRATPSLPLMLGIAEALETRVEELFGPAPSDALARDIERLAGLASSLEQELLVHILRQLAGLDSASAPLRISSQEIAP